MTRTQHSPRVTWYRNPWSQPLMSGIMISLPYFLLAIGILVFIVACFLGSLSHLSGSRRNVIDPRMSNKQIMKNLRREQRMSLPTIVGLIGLLCILVSILWRLALFIATWWLAAHGH